MSVSLNEPALRRRMAPHMDEPAVVQGIRVLTSDPFFIAFFMMSVSEGEAMGEAGVAGIRQQQIASLIHDIERQEREERGHKDGTLRLTRELFPQFFDDGEYRFSSMLTGRDYYVSVLEKNRARLKERDRYSRLNLYMTTTFGYEVMVVLLYSAVAAAMRRSPLPEPIRAAVSAELDRILAEEETHLETEDQHNQLLAADRSTLPSDAQAMLDALDRLTVEDYHWAAELSMQEIVKMMGRYADGPAFRAFIEAGTSKRAGA